MRSSALTFCFLRLQDSHAWAVRCLLSGSTLGRVMATVQSCLSPPGLARSGYSSASASASGSGGYWSIASLGARR
jgi:hypothetical protein